MAQSIPLVECGLDPFIDLNVLKFSFVQHGLKQIENLSRTSLYYLRGEPCKNETLLYQMGVHFKR